MAPDRALSGGTSPNPSDGGDGGGGVPPPAVSGTPRKATMFACVATLSNTLLGVSVVGVAGGFARAGCAVSFLRRLFLLCCLFVVRYCTISSIVWWTMVIGCQFFLFFFFCFSFMRRKVMYRAYIYAKEFFALYLSTLR